MSLTLNKYKKNVDVKLSPHEAFLEYPSSGYPLNQTNRKLKTIKFQISMSV